jgi:hypothetical protein
MNFLIRYPILAASLTQLLCASCSPTGLAPEGSAVGVTINPKIVQVSYGGQMQFSVVADRSVVWSITEGSPGGTVSSAGLYIAPSATGTYHVRAVSKIDATETDLATVAVTAPAGTPPALVKGVWTDLTPPGLNLGVPTPALPHYGIAQFAIDTRNPYVIYVCVDQQGMWKTTDGGTSWNRLGDPTRPATATTAHYLDSPIAVRVDPSNSNHLVATQGVRGATLGFWISQDGGSTWTMPASFVATHTTIDVTTLTVDPTDFNHNLVGSHSPWPGLSNAGILETKDGGATWIVHQPRPEFNAGSIGIHFLYSPAHQLGNADTWLVVTDGHGVWRTTDAGVTWTNVSNYNLTHGGQQLYYASNGYVYAGFALYPARSSDNGVTWEQLTTLPYFYYYSVYGDGTNLYTQLANTGTNAGQGSQPYYTSLETDGKSWAPYDPNHTGAQTFGDGPFMMLYDPGHQIMYSANWNTGFWALKIGP